MSIRFEYDALQNPALISIMQHAAVNEFCTLSNNEKGLKFPMLFILTPIILNKCIVESICNRTGRGCIYKAMAAEPIAWTCLQKRMELHAEKTLQAIQLGILSGLIRLDEMTGEVLTTGNSFSYNYTDRALKHMLAAAKKMGKTFHELPNEKIMHTLGIVF